MTGRTTNFAQGLSRREWQGSLTSPLHGANKGANPLGDVQVLLTPQPLSYIDFIL